jgi:RNA polymerase sigma factor (sigma-70 family)
MDDLEFVQRCIKADKQAWDEFLNKYSRLIYNYIYSVLKTKGTVLTQENIHDLFQEIFLSLINDNFKKLKTFQARNGASLASWLRQVVVHYAIDYLRRLKPALSLDEEIEEGFSLKDIISNGSESVRSVLMQEEKRSHLKDCIERLNNNDKYFLELYLNRGLKLEEIKKVLRISRGAVDMRKAGIMSALRDCFKRQGLELDF